MGISPVIALVLNNENILKASNIQIAALLCILPKVFRGYDNRTLLYIIAKNHIE